MTQNLTRVEAGGDIEADEEETPAVGTVQVARDAVAVQFVGDNGAGGLTAQLATLTAQLTTVQAGQDIATGQATTAGTVEAIAAAVAAVNTTMGQIRGLKEAEGLSDTVVDAIGILENAWAELGEVQLGNNTTVGNIPEEAEDITNVTQEQVDILGENDSIS